ncbi:MAG: hypothetical protein GWO38_34825, partial [Phycisphaerae bacterium]|nr:hypothetical protein [Phycisphaerae bacterium]NIX32658.1 hypothetical protein [Phycisphaerae bacterium]
PRRRSRTNENAAAIIEDQASSKSLTAQEEFEAEYAYVLKDLRWVFILAAIMFALLIALNLFLTT